MQVHQIYERLTLPRVRVLALLAEGRSIRQLACDLGYTYEGARSHIRDLRDITGCGSCEEMAGGRQREPWLAYVGRCATCASYRDHDAGA
jgi:DNA-binding CsgD family transcriptional regulator